MPKIKTHSSAKKRFKVTGSGKVKRPRANHNHRFDGKSKRSKAVNGEWGLVANSDMPRVKKMLVLG